VQAEAAVTGQLDLFQYAATRGAARADGPATSLAAAHSIDGQVLRDQQALVLGGVVSADWPGRKDGATAWEVWCELRSRPDCPRENVVAKRLGELAAAGFLERTLQTRPGSSHRQQTVWVLTGKGRAWHAMRNAS
jgi:hypothetical protein